MAGLFGNWFNQTFNPNNQLGDFLTGLTRNIFGIQTPQNTTRPNYTPQQPEPLNLLAPQFAGSKMGYGGTYAPQSVGVGGSHIPTPAEVAAMQQNAPPQLIPGIGHAGTAPLQPWQVAGGLGSANPGFGAPVQQPGFQPLQAIRAPQLTPQQAALLSSGLNAQLLRDKLNRARKRK